VRKLTAALCALAVALPAAFIVVIALPAGPAHADFMDNWWVDMGWGVENDPERPNVEFRVCSMRSWGLSTPFTVDYATSDGTATAGADYVATSGTLIFLPMNVQNCQTVGVPILDDPFYESDWEGDGDGWFPGAEYFRFDLSNPSPGGPPIDEYAHSYGIIDDDPDDWPAAILSDDKTIIEGGNVGIPIRIDMEKSYPVSVHYETVGVSASSADYVPLSGDITFEPGETRKYILGVAEQDSLNEANESFRVELSNNQPADRTWIYRGSTTTITDDDPLPRLLVDDVSIPEPANGSIRAPFTVSLTEPSGREVAVAYSTRDGSAVAHQDYTPVTGTLTFPAGVTHQTVDVPVHASASAQDAKSFGLILDSPTNAALERGDATANIVDAGPVSGGSASAQPATAPAPAPVADAVPAPDPPPPTPATEVAPARSSDPTPTAVKPATKRPKAAKARSPRGGKRVRNLGWRARSAPSRAKYARPALCGRSAWWRCRGR